MNWSTSEACIDFGLPTAMVLVAAYLFWTGLKNYRRLPRRRCPACGYDMRVSAGLECPECGHVAVSQKLIEHGSVRRLRLVLGLLLFTPAVLIVLFFAIHLPRAHFANKKVERLRQLTASGPTQPYINFRLGHWVKTNPDWVRLLPSISGHDAASAREDYETAIMTGRIFKDKLAPSDLGNPLTLLKYAKSFLYSPQLHYGKYIDLELPSGLIIVTVPDQPNQTRLSSKAVAGLLTPFNALIDEVRLDTTQNAEFDVEDFGPFESLHFASAITNDNRVARFLGRDRAKRAVVIRYSGYARDLAACLEGVIANAQPAEFQSLKIQLRDDNASAPISAETFIKLASLPNFYAINLQSFTVNAQDVAQALSELRNSPKSGVHLNLRDCSDEHLRSLKGAAKTGLTLNLNHSAVTSQGLSWMADTGLRNVSLHDAPGIKIDSADLFPDSLEYLSCKNVDLTDQGLLALADLELKGLSLDSCPVTEAGITAYLKKAKGLHSFRLTGQGISPELCRLVVSSPDIYTLELEDPSDEAIEEILNMPPRAMNAEVTIRFFLNTRWDDPKITRLDNRLRAVNARLILIWREKSRPAPMTDKPAE